MWRTRGAEAARRARGEVDSSEMRDYCKPHADGQPGATITSGHDASMVAMSSRTYASSSVSVYSGRPSRKRAEKVGEVSDVNGRMRTSGNRLTPEQDLSSAHGATSKWSCQPVVLKRALTH